MENAFTMYNKNYYGCKVCDGTVHVSLPCPDCDDTDFGKYEVVSICKECEGTRMDHVWNCENCNGEGKVFNTFDLYNNILEVAKDYPEAISITKWEKK
jgi:hypothetical protein